MRPQCDRLETQDIYHSSVQHIYPPPLLEDLDLGGVD